MFLTRFTPRVTTAGHVCVRPVATFNVGRFLNLLHFDPNITLTTKTRAKNMGNELSTTKKAKKKPARWTRDSNPGRPMHC